MDDAGLRAELLGLLAGLDDGGRGVCHYDFHPANVLVGPNGWVVIDWLTAAAGPSSADLARTLVLWGRQTGEPVVTSCAPCDGAAGSGEASATTSSTAGSASRQGPPRRGLRGRGGVVARAGGGRCGATLRLTRSRAATSGGRALELLGVGEEA